MSLPLLRAFPALASLPRAALGAFPSPVEQVQALPDDVVIWLKRDDRNAPVAAGNKVRALEFLLAGVGRGDTVVTVGGQGSAHVLATAAHSRRLGASTVAFRWPHEMSAGSLEVAAAAAALCERVIETPSIVHGLLRAHLYRLSHRVHWVPFGGASPLGTLGHVNAAMELAEQVAVGMLPVPARIVVPMGTGCTVAGMLLGITIAKLPTTIVAVRCGPRVGSTRRQALRLAGRTRSLLQRASGVRVPKLDATRLEVVHDAYGGAYGRPHPVAEEAARALRDRTGLRLDSTYGAKAWMAALRLASAGPVLFWVTLGFPKPEGRPG